MTTEITAPSDDHPNHIAGRHPDDRFERCSRLLFEVALDAQASNPIRCAAAEAFAQLSSVMSWDVNDARDFVDVLTSHLTQSVTQVIAAGTLPHALYALIYPEHHSLLAELLASLESRARELRLDQMIREICTVRDELEELKSDDSALAFRSKSPDVPQRRLSTSFEIGQAEDRRIALAAQLLLELIVTSTKASTDTHAVEDAFNQLTPLLRWQPYHRAFVQDLLGELIMFPSTARLIQSIVSWSPLKPLNRCWLPFLRTLADRAASARSLNALRTILELVSRYENLTEEELDWMFATVELFSIVALRERDLDALHSVTTHMSQMIRRLRRAAKSKERLSASEELEIPF